MKKVLKKTAEIIGIIIGSIGGILGACCVFTLIWGAAQMSKGEIT